MIALIAVLLAADLPAPLEVTTSSLVVFTDKKGHYVMFDPKKPDETLFYGDGKTMNQVPVRGFSSDGSGSAEMTFWDPRFTTSVWLKSAGDGKSAEVSCQDVSMTLEPVNAEESKKLTEGAKFFTQRFTRLPDQLLRDDSGSYYFIDRLRTRNDERRDFRLFIGPRGKLKQQPLKDVVDDTEGMIFSTKNGELRLVTGKSESTQKWVQGKKERKLITIPLDDSRNVRLVYVELGVFDGALGTPCDDAK